MKLQEFIEDTLSQIIDSTINIQNKYGQGSGVVINPNVRYETQNKPLSSLDRGGYSLVQEIEFDVLLASISEGGTEGGVGVFFAPFTIGGKAKNTTGNQETTRVNFSIPLRFPPGK